MRARLICAPARRTFQVGRVATVTGTLARFATTAEKTIAALTAWAQSTAYLVGDRRTANGNAYHCTVAGTSLGSGTGPSGTGTAIVDGTATWRYLGVGTGAVDAPFQAEQAGAIGALAGTLATIATPVFGWNNVVNLLDAVVGKLKETNT